jgi:uncharacterized membrane protein
MYVMYVHTLSIYTYEHICIYFHLGAILGEILICQKDANTKTRDSVLRIDIYIYMHIYI